MGRKTLIVFGLIVIALVAFTQWRAYARESHAEAAYPPLGQFVDVDGRQVHAHIMGSGPDLVMIHGASGTTRDFSFGFAQRMAEKYRVILLDRPGMGWSDRADARFEGAWNPAAESPLEQAQILQKAATQLGVKKPIVMGHSFGGAVAIAWAITAPNDTAAVVTVAGVANTWPGELGLLYRVNSSAIGGALVIPLITAFVPETKISETLASIFEPQAAPEGYMDHIGPEMSLRRGMMRANARQVNFLKPHVAEMMPSYSSLTMPFEIIHGDADTIVPLHVHARPLSTQVPNATLTVLKGVGHMPHHVDPDAIESAIDRAAAASGLR